MRAIFAVLASLVVCAAAAAAPPAPFAFDPGGFVYFNQNVEQQGAFNPTQCVWSGYDYWYASGDGPLANGANASTSVCVIEDAYAHPVRAIVTAAAPTLTVTVQVGDDTYRLVPTVNKWKVWTYQLDTYTENYADVSSLPLVPDSNGGRGEPEHVTLTIRNESGKASKSFAASLTIATVYYG